MINLFPAIIASTHQYFQPNRTQIIYKPETVKEVVKQANQLKLDGTPLRVFLHPPEKEQNNSKAQSPIIGALKSTPKTRSNALIGFVIGCEEVQEDGQIKAKALIDIQNDEALEAINKRRKELCFILQVQFDPEKSFEKIESAVNKMNIGNLEINTQAKHIKYLLPPIKCLYLYIGLKNSSTNPYLIIL